MRISLYDVDDMEKVPDIIIDDKSNFKTKKVKVDKNTNCSCCGRSKESIKLQSTNPSNYRGLTDLLYVARVQKNDVLLCARCVATKTVLLKYDGKSVISFDNKTKKYKMDKSKVDKATGTLEDEHDYY